MLRLFFASLAATLFASCGNCPIDCRYEQPLILQNEAGSPLAPARVRVGNDVFECGAPDIRCEVNRVVVYLPYPIRPPVVRVDAASGEFFEARIEPKYVKGKPPESGCGCSGRYEELTLTLRKP